MEKRNENLVNFFKKVNKMRTKVKSAENPMNSYEEFKDNENDEEIIRKGMSQYEDLVSTLKRLKNKKSKILEDIKNNSPKHKNEEKPQKIEEKKEKSPKNEKKEKSPKNEKNGKKSKKEKSPKNEKNEKKEKKEKNEKKVKNDKTDDKNEKTDKKKDDVVIIYTKIESDKEEEQKNENEMIKNGNEKDKKDSVSPKTKNKKIKQEIKKLSRILSHKNASETKKEYAIETFRQNVYNIIEQPESRAQEQYVERLIDKCIKIAKQKA